MNIMVKGFVSGAVAMVAALGARMPALACLVGGGVGLGLDSVECPEPHPSFLLSLHLPALLGFGSTSQRSAYQTIDSPEAPTDFYAGAENKGHTSQGY